MKLKRAIIASLILLAGCNNPEGAMQRGNMAYRAGNLPQASQYYQQALGSEVTRAAASFNLGRVSLESGDPTKALEYLDQALELEVEYPMVRVYRARALLALQRTDEARQDLERVTKAHPKSGEGFLELAKLQASQGELETAAQTIQEARRNRTLFEEATILSAQYKHDTGDLQGSIAELEQLVETHGFRIQTHFTLAEYLLEAKDYREAERRFRRGLEMQPTNTGALLGLADALAGQGKKEEALKLYEAVAASGPPDHPLVKRAVEGKEALATSEPVNDRP